MPLGTYRPIYECVGLSGYVQTCVLLSLADDFPESTGVKRIVQALNANVWSNVVMKNGE